jgi:predicted transcriptional regulator YdeE
MQNIKEKKDIIKLVGLSARTNNINEMNPLTGKIGPLVQKFFLRGLGKKIANLKNPGTTYSVYTEYESDHTGDYTYFIGEEVTHFSENLQTNDTSEKIDLKTLEIPAQTYIKFTTEPGPLPQSVIAAWQKIWLMNDAQMGGKRNYIADFEVYDNRAENPMNAILDVYIGIAD